MLVFVLGFVFALEYLFDDESSKKKKTRGRGRQAAKMFAAKRGK